MQGNEREVSHNEAYVNGALSRLEKTKRKCLA